MDSDGSCFLLEITQFAHQMTCFTGHIILGDRLARTRKSHLTKRMVCSKTLAICHFDQFGACSPESNFDPLVQEF